MTDAAPEALIDDEIDDQPVIRVLVAAAGRPMPVTRAPRSVFEFLPPAVKAKHRAVNWPLVNAAYQGRVSVASETGVKVVGLAYPSARWTQERADKEEARRARQTPPKPVKAARTRSLKLARMLDQDFE